MGKLSNRVLSYFIFIGLVLGSFAQTSCLIEEPHIALGDKFNLEQNPSDHIFTIGFTVKGECSTTPEVLLQSKDGKTTKTLSSFASKTIDVVIKEETQSTPYKKKSLFFKVTDADFAQFETWAVTIGTQVAIEPVEFPSRWRENLSTFRMFVVADMDLTETSVPTVQRIKEMKPKDYDFLVHVGDFAYEIESSGGKKGDDFFAQMSLTSRRIPYLITPGNHELNNEGKLMNYRFRMPNTEETGMRQNHFFDFVLKGTYFMVLDFDFLYIYRDHKPDPFDIIHDWMKERISILEKRTDVTWKVFVSHRPFSCSDFMAGDCYVNMYYFRRYEDLLTKHGFHFSLNGHLHTYTRSRPLNRLKALPQSKIGSGAMVSIINGHCGTDHFFGKQSDIDRIRSALIDIVDSTGPSYTLVEVNKDRFQTQLVRADNFEIRDTFSIDRTSLDDEFGKRQRTWWVKYLIILIIAGIIAILVVASYIYQKKQDLLFVNIQLKEASNSDTYQKVSTYDEKAQVTLKPDETLSKVSTHASPDRKSPQNFDVSPLN